MKNVLGFLIVILLFSSVAFANIAGPKTPKGKTARSIDTTLMIRIDRNATEARLVIPKSQLKTLRAELEQLDDDANTAAVTGSFTRMQTIVSGLFLSLAFVCGGIWFARSGKSATRTGKALVIGAVVFATGAVTTLVYANAGPPPEARSITGKIFTQSVHMYKFASGKIKVETSDEARNVELIVPDVKTEAKLGEEE